MIILMSSEAGLKGLRIGLIIYYIGFFAAFLLLQVVYVAAFITFLVTYSHTAENTTDWYANLAACIIQIVQYGYLLLCTFVAMFFIAGITAKLIHILARHYSTFKSQLKEQYEDRVISKHLTRAKSALVTVGFFMVAIMLTLIFKCVQYIILIMASIFDIFGGTTGTYLLVVANCCFAAIVFAVVIIAIVLYSPRSFKSIQHSAESFLKKLDLQKKKAETMDGSNSMLLSSQKSIRVPTASSSGELQEPVIAAPETNTTEAVEEIVEEIPSPSTL